MNRIQKVLGSAAVASLLMLAPLAASADTVNASSSTGVIISPSGIVRVIGANVTAASNGVFNAVTTIGNVIMSWIVNISASTKISGNGSNSATTSGITVGDKVSFTGTLSSSTTTLLTVAATKVRDLTTFPPRHVDTQATSTANSSGTTTPGIIAKHSRDKEDGDNDEDDKGNGNIGVNVGIHADGNAKGEHSKGTHAGLNFLGGFHFGNDD